jgi:hypothetical protein
MMTKLIIYVFTLTAYMLSLAHSVIPHHHHKTVQEAEAHDHADSHHGHNSDKHHHGHDSQDTPEPSHHFLFFSHDVNADVLIKHGSVDNPVKNKKPQCDVTLKDAITLRVRTAYLAFHPPQDDPAPDLSILSSNSLRGPPYLFI